MKEKIKRGVYGANELLEYGGFPDFSGKTVAISGGGNTAMDVARTVKRKNPKKVLVIYRRAREQMPAEVAEVQAAIEEGIDFLFQNNIVKVLGEDKVQGVECIKTELVKVEGDRERPVNIEGSNYEIPLDYVIMAVGSKPNSEVLGKLGLELNDWGYIKVDDNFETSEKKVFAAGDLIRKQADSCLGSKVGKRRSRKNK